MKHMGMTPVQLDGKTDPRFVAMERKAKRLGLSMVTMMNRPALLRQHDLHLTLLGDGAGGWELDRLVREE